MRKDITMKEINLGYGYKIKRLDSRNWELWHYHETKKGNGRKGCKVGEEKWHKCGKYYQELRAALLAVYEMELRKGNDAVDLEEALARAEEIERSLKAVSVNLLRLK